MFIEKPRELFKHCIIKPLDNQEGLIVRIKYDKCGAELLDRYFYLGTVLHNWFYDFEIELKEPNQHGVNFFKEYDNDRKIK